MGTLILDIETASPFEEPPENSNDTKYYELFAISLAYAEDVETTPETEVLFRRGSWEDTHTTDLYQRMLEWCDQRDIDRLLTYNGAWFDGKHLLNWAQKIDATTGHNFLERTESLFENHVDVALAAADEYRSELWDDQHILPDWKVYELAGIDNNSVWYDDYDFPDNYLSEIDESGVQGKHIGQVLGEKYVDNVTAGIEDTSVHRELTQLLKDYCKSDVADLIELYTALGGPTLDEPYRRTAVDIDYST
jgi:DNA polymerase elongation subunit (family B)